MTSHVYKRAPKVTLQKKILVFIIFNEALTLHLKSYLKEKTSEREKKDFKNDVEKYKMYKLCTQRHICPAWKSPWSHRLYTVDNLDLFYRKLCHTRTHD